VEFQFFGKNGARSREKKYPPKKLGFSISKLGTPGIKQTPIKIKF
jgi:hypothetical protein